MWWWQSGGLLELPAALLLPVNLEPVAAAGERSAGIDRQGVATAEGSSRAVIGVAAIDPRQRGARDSMLPV